jgi:sugar phosphate isomerase/epimerase
MKILFFCPRWGSEDLSVEQFTEKVKRAGYDGVELGLPLTDEPARKRILKAIQGQELEWIAQHYETANPDPESYLLEYRSRLENLAAAQPLLINAQTGKDWFAFEDNQRLIAAAHEISEKTGVKIVHETHRGKFSFCARSTTRFLQSDLKLRLAADFSHWCVVSESLLEDQQDDLRLAIERTDHIHARVGHSQGPQVNDPRAPEWAQALNAHLSWWDKIIAGHRQETPILSITPEFGSVPYLPTLPYTAQPVASQWEINLYMMHLLRERYMT